jgi:hypothetical protein
LVIYIIYCSRIRSKGKWRHISRYILKMIIYNIFLFIVCFVLISHFCEHKVRRKQLLLQVYYYLGSSQLRFHAWCLILFFH